MNPNNANQPRSRYWWSYFQEKWGMKFVTAQNCADYLQESHDIDFFPFIEFVTEQKLIDKSFHECIILWKFYNSPE